MSTLVKPKLDGDDNATIDVVGGLVHEFLEMLGDGEACIYKGFTNIVDKLFEVFPYVNRYKCHGCPPFYARPPKLSMTCGGPF